MQPQTKATLEHLERSDWFSSVGTYDGIQDRNKVILLSSWAKAMAACSSVEWENLCLEAVNHYCERIAERSQERFSQWNEIAESLRPITEPLVRRKIEHVVREHDLPQVFEDTVQWDIHHVCMESEYADVYQPGFYASQAYWYVKGHFPCGWEGEFPSGTLIIF